MAKAAAAGTDGSNASRSIATGQIGRPIERKRRGVSGWFADQVGLKPVNGYNQKLFDPLAATATTLNTTECYWICGL